jgi:hypothetical protein
VYKRRKVAPRRAWFVKKLRGAKERTKALTASRTLTLGQEKEIHDAGVDLLMQKSTHEYQTARRALSLPKH